MPMGLCILYLVVIYSHQIASELTLNLFMNSSIGFYTLNLGLFIVHIEGSQMRNFKLRFTEVHEDCFYLSS